VRIVSGHLRGRNIATPSGRGTRPTSDQTRESIFNILEHAEWATSLNGAHVMDIFAGSGALGLEAISRGAEFCVFVETEPKARAAIRDNISKMGLDDNARLHRYDARKLKLAPANAPSPFSHVFMDPPYNKGLWRPVLSRLLQHNYLTPDGVVILEESREAEIDPRHWDILADKTWGAARVLFLQPKQS